MDRRKIERRDGSVTLVGSGPAGAVSLDAWTYQGEVRSLLATHLTHSEVLVPSACDYLPTGTCYPDQTYRHGQEAAEALMAYQDEYAWQVVEEWYRDRIEGRQHALLTQGGLDRSAHSVRDRRPGGIPPSD